MNQPKNPAALARFLKIVPLCDGVLASSEIAMILDENPKYIQKMMLKYDLPRLGKNVVPSHLNSFYKCGRHINKDGYASVLCPPEFHGMKNKNGRVLEHRLVVARKIKRNLLPLEVVDHIDGIRLHNDPSNLRLFDSNSDHLRKTLSGNIPRWSEDGKIALDLSRRQSSAYQLVDTHLLKVKSGDARLIEILRTALLFGIDSPFLLGMSHHIEKAGIDLNSYSSLKRALADLYRKYE
ncbi:MAG: HNH endonuclease [Emcibacteraceae bacterium]|nr:HNH endonuclease [Emcibacteraceae bacterium]